MNKEYNCDNCGSPMSKSGYYTAKKRGYCRNCKDSKNGKTEEVGGVTSFSLDDGSLNSSSSSDPSTLFTVGEVPEDPEEADQDQSGSWEDFTIDDSESTENIPSALKMASAMSGGSGSSVDLQLMHETNLQLLKMGLTGVDFMITKYGQVATMNEDYVCKHSESDKDLVAGAQYRYLMEKGVNPSDYVSSGGVALALTGSYILPPVMKIQKKKKREVFGNVIKSIPKRFNIFSRFRRRRGARNEQDRSN